MTKNDKCTVTKRQMGKEVQNCHILLFQVAKHEIFFTL